MKALTLTQPWATLVAIGAKKIETRSWGVTYLGPIAIHAGKEFPLEARRFALRPPCLDVMHAWWGGVINDWPLDALRGKVIATGMLVDVVRIEEDLLEGPFDLTKLGEIGEHEAAFGDYTPGRFAWVLRDVVKIDPVPARGRLGLWDWQP